MLVVRLRDRIGHAPDRAREGIVEPAEADVADTDLNALHPRRHQHRVDGGGDGVERVDRTIDERLERADGGVHAGDYRLADDRPKVLPGRPNSVDGGGRAGIDARQRFLPDLKDDLGGRRGSTGDFSPDIVEPEPLADRVPQTADDVAERNDSAAGLLDLVTRQLELSRIGLQRRPMLARKLMRRNRDCPRRCSRRNRDAGKDRVRRS